MVVFTARWALLSASGFRRFRIKTFGNFNAVIPRNGKHENGLALGLWAQAEQMCLNGTLLFERTVYSLSDNLYITYLL